MSSEDDARADARADARELQPDDCQTVRQRISKWRLAMILSCVGLGLLLSLMDATIVATMLLDITKDLGGFQKSQWVVLSYTLVDGGWYISDTQTTTHNGELIIRTGLAVFLARLSDVVGRKLVICASLVLFLAGSMACGASTTINQLIGFRALQGSGAAGLYATSLVVYLEMSPPRLLVLMFALLGGIVALAGVMGPIIGGLLATHVGWRYAFWINGPCCVVALLLLLLFWREDMADKKARAQLGICNLDFPGAILIIAGVTLPIFVISQASIGVYAWSSPTTISVLVVSALMWICLLVWQQQMPWWPRFSGTLSQLPWEILTNRILLAALIDTILASHVLAVAIFHIPIRAQVTGVYNAFQSAILLLPLLASSAVGAACAGVVSCKKNLTFWALSISCTLMIISTALLSRLSDDNIPSFAAQRGYEAILGFGAGMNMATTTLLAALHAQVKNHGTSRPIHVCVLHG
ncbi:hypothetical protein MY10362_008003 [Beauveria mimosiformis]